MTAATARAGPRAHALALALFAGVAVASTHPLPAQPTRLVPGNADALLNAWSMAWVVHALPRDPLHLLRANAFHPSDAALGFSEPVVGPALLSAPFQLLTGNDILSYNLTYVLTLALSAYTMFLLAHELTGSIPGSIIAGEVFAFTTANYEAAARIQVASGQWAPLALLFLVRLRRSGRLRDGLGLGLAFALQGLSCNYYLLFFSTLLAVVVPLALWPRRRSPPWKPLLAAAAVVAVLVGPLALAQYRELQDLLVLPRPPRTGATWATFRQTLGENWIFGAAWRDAAISYDDRHFPGFAPVLLGVLAVPLLLPALRRRIGLSLPAGGAGLHAVIGLSALAFLLALGPRIQVPFGPSIPGPYALLHEHVPGYAMTRNAVRFLMFARIGLAAMAALTVAAAIARLGRPTGLVLAGALALLAPLEHLSTPLPTWPISSGAEVPQVYRWLAELPEGTPILEFPPRPPHLRRWESFWQHYATYHWLPIVNGYSGYFPAHYDFVYHELLELPSVHSLQVLRALGVQYVVFHPSPPGDAGTDRAVSRFERRIAQFADSMELVASFDDAGRYRDALPVFGGERVYRVIGANGESLRPAAAAPAGGPPLPRAGWACESDPPARSPCELAFDGDPATAFRGGPYQTDGQRLRVRFPRPTSIGGISLETAAYSHYYPRELDVRVMSAGAWEDVHERLDRREYLWELIHQPAIASMDVDLDDRKVEGVEIRLLEPPTATFKAWAIAELSVYPPSPSQ